MPSMMPAASLQDKGMQNVEYVLMQAHGQRKRAGIGAPSNEELVQSKTPAEGRRAERAEEPTLLVGPTTLTWRTPEGSSRLARSDERTSTHKEASTCMLHPYEEKASEPLTEVGWHAGGGEGGGAEGSCPVQRRAPSACEGGKGKER